MTVPIQALARGDKALKAAAVFWFAAVMAGQWIFGAYILSFYGGAVLDGDLNGWNALHETQGLELGEEQRKRFGYIPGDLIGNVFLGLHLLLAAIVTFGGTLQLIPFIRDRFRPFHRWNGRLFVMACIIASVAGIWLSWVRDNPGGFYVSVATTINGVLIIGAALMAWRLAVARKIDAHHRWALRLFILASGVWFFRVMFMAWMIAAQGPVGHTDDFKGPFDLFVAFGSYLVPWAVLEIYMRVKSDGGRAAKTVMAVALGLLTLIMVGGTIGAAAFMWLPAM